MTLKTCAYKDCENFELKGMRQGNYCMFSFPKEPSRKEEWMQLGMVDRNLPQMYLYMCSDHFDEKYIAKSPRRWNLVCTAKPRPFQPSNEESTISIDYSDIIAKAELLDSLQEEDETGEETIIVNSDQADKCDNYVVESTVPESDEDQNIYETIEYLDDLYKGNEEEIVVNKRRKISLDDQEHRSSSLKILNFQVDQQQRLQPKSITATSFLSVKKIEPFSNKNDDDLIQFSSVDSALLDCNEVTVFVFKGEEYVQMSKEYYFREKLDLLKKLRIYENAFKKIKQNVDSVCTNIN